MNRNRLKIFAAFPLLTFAAACSAPSYDVEVYLSPKFRERLNVYPSLEVDVVGVNANERARFESCPTDEYFAVGNALRENTDRSTLYFSEDDPSPKRLSDEDPVWEKFGSKGAETLFVVANLPAFLFGRNDGAEDARKISIPLESVGFFGSKTRIFEISPAGIVELKKRPEPEKNPSAEASGEKAAGTAADNRNEKRRRTR